MQNLNKIVQELSAFSLSAYGRVSKIARNSAFDCHLSPVGRQMAIAVSDNLSFDLRSSIVLTFLIAAYTVLAWSQSFAS